MTEHDVMMMRKVALVFSQTVAALVDLESMKALNAYRAHREEAQAFDEKAFLDLIDKYGLGWNTVLITLDS